MGNTHNNINYSKYLSTHSSNEYKRVMKLTEESTSMAGSDSNGNTQGLTLEQILLLKPPHGVSLSFDHLGTLFPVSYTHLTLPTN